MLFSSKAFDKTLKYMRPVVLGDINIMAFDYCDLIIGRF